MKNESLPPEYFEEIYAKSDDPWGFASREYELHKYLDTLMHLPRPHYRAAFEPGCSIGVLSGMLAARVDNLLSVDVSTKALEKARYRNGDKANIDFQHMQFPSQVPTGTFDLVLLSEVAYYWGDEEFDRARDEVMKMLEPGGDLVLVHWTPFVEDYPLTGDEVHERFIRFSQQNDSLRHLESNRETTYRLDVFRKLNR
ncbi:class I SAM-dependent DNA methyltransferase [Persicitalea jodogahamensis]|uniref:Methyltransferase n=1 Tax=Persicitalea jodogahamensis TaxID=402147 RepID=A0A8J3GA10_9BACT|nr:SAM-dependent methyltransferase [Persicitalea jodogahamensis]GHB67623.1 methyltransferase [Persicitalea jodogahamensis]